jgi:adenylate cyclase
MTTHRKLAAILSADAAGYSRLMADDEAETLRALNEFRDLFRKRIEAHGGRLIDTAGDSILAEFPSAVEAVDCAVEIQHELGKRNSQLAEHRRLQFRIGINLGDVIEQEDGTIYGDGVNVAARLQQLAEPGGICISGTAFDQVEGKLPLQFKFIGEQQVKNIAKPVRAYRVLMDAPAVKSRPAPIARRRALALGAAAIIAVMLAVGVVWKVQKPTTERTSVVADPALAMPSGPSIAVLPFVNMSGNTEEEYFADGMTDELITALSRLRGLIVIARNSTFQYKGKAVDVRKIAQELGVRYVLEGSVRKERDRVRVTTQLVDAINGNQLWAERYDRPLRDIFSVQDEITQKIVTELDVQLVEGIEARSFRRTTNNVEAYQYFLQGRENTIRMTRESLTLGRQLLEKAIKLDPKFAMAYAFLAANRLLVVIFGFTDSPAQDLDRALELAERAIVLDESQGYPHVMVGRIYMQKRELDKGLPYAKKAIELEPNGADVNAIYAHMLEAAGRPAEALAHINRAMRLGPHPQAWWPWLQGLCLRQLGREDEAITAMRRSVALSPEWLAPHAFLVDVYVAAGRDAEARTEAREVLRLDPTFSVDAFLKGFDWYKDPNMIKGYETNLRKAGLK